MDRRTFLFGLAASAGLLALPNKSLFAQEKVIHPDEILRIFDNVINTELYERVNGVLRPIEKARSLIYHLRTSRFGIKSRFVDGLYYENGIESKTHPIRTSWVEYVTGKKVLALDPERQIIFDIGGNTNYKYLSSPRSIAELVDNRNSKLEGEGLLKVLDKISSDFHYKPDVLPRAYIQDYWQTPKETEKLKTGDCEDLTFYSMVELYREQITSKWAYGKICEGNVYHIWIEMNSKDLSSEYIFDPTTASIMRKKGVSKDQYFQLPLTAELEKEKEGYKARLNDEERKAIFQS